MLRSVIGVKRFAPALLNAASPYKKQLSLSESDEWHFDETLTSKLMARLLRLVWLRL